MKRNDAKLVYDIPLYNKIFPYMMKRRTESLVFHSMEIDVSHTLEFIRKYNSQKPEIRLRFFYVFCAAVMRTMVIRPELNRFISKYHYWQRNDLSMNFVVKEDLTDEAPETSNPLEFQPEMTLKDYAKVLDDYIERSRHVSEQGNSTDRLIDLLLHLPTWLVAFIIKLMGLLDRGGKPPKWLSEADGLHTSVFISNLGSIGINGTSPFHHLYEWGTTSMFITLGQMERKREFDESGKLVNSRDTIKVGITVDERITSGYYFVKSLYILKGLLEHPEELEKVPELPPAVLTKKQYKKKLKEEAKNKKK